MSTAPDRITELLAQKRVTGIDYIYVHPDQKNLEIFFLRKVTDLNGSPKLPATLKAADIKIYSPEISLPDIEVDEITGWNLPAKGPHVLKIRTKLAGDFSLYNFLIIDPRIDPYFNDVSFSFKAGCPGDLDCKPPDHECPPDETVDFPIDYLARDFWSYRRALLDFASLRYPDWKDRLEADAGIMLTEVMSALADEMAYYQDRVKREAYLETASQRRSIRRHARLIDYHMHDGLGANVWLDYNVDTGVTAIPAGTDVFSLSDDNSKINFETGRGLTETIQGKVYTVSEANNEFEPHIWDEDDTCLLVGETELYINGHHAAELVFDDFPEGQDPGKWVLIKTNPTDASRTERAQYVRLISITDTKDPVFNTDITHLVWEEEQALQYEFDLTILRVRANIVPATSGKTKEAYFLVDDSLSDLTQPEITAFYPYPAGETVNRNGHDNSRIHLFTLPDTQSDPLVYFGNEDQHYNIPEISLEEVEYDTVSDAWIEKPFTEPWIYNNSLVGVHSSKSGDNHFTLDDGTWQRVVGYQRIGKEIEHKDYAMNSGVTVRFGDGEFGRIPDKGTVFRVRYRTGGTRRSNVAAGTIKHFLTAITGITVTNPLPSFGGEDAETAAELRQLASDAYRKLTYRAVRPEDYAEAAERLDWVQKAGSAFRWTGSWLTAFVTPDPLGKVVLESDDRYDLMNQLNRFRQAGREVNVMDPEYADIDIEIDICVSADSYPGEVKERVYEALLGKNCYPPVIGYFSADRFTFGTFLERSTLEAAIQDVQGVKAIEEIRFRRRGWFGIKILSELSYDPGKNSIIRVANDPLHPERGTLKIYTHGGL